MAVYGKHYLECKHTGCQSPVIYAFCPNLNQPCVLEKKPFKASWQFMDPLY